MPRHIFKDPFRGGDNILVLCDCYEPPRMNPDGTVRNKGPALPDGVVTFRPAYVSQLFGGGCGLFAALFSAF